MAYRLEKQSNYIIITNTVRGNEFEYPANSTVYRENDGIITISSMNGLSVSMKSDWTEFVDSSDTPFDSLDDLVSWLRNHTGTETSGDVFLDISKGLVIGTDHINKFGANSDVSTSAPIEDVWDGGGVYPFPTTVDITHLNQATDQVAMRGGTINIQGLDENWDLFVQDVDLDLTDTTTQVALSVPLRRVFRLKVLENIVADSDIHVCNLGDTIHYATMQAGNNQTLMAIFTVPRNTTAYLVNYYCTVIDATNKSPTSTRFGLWMADRHNNYEFQIKHAVGIPQHGGMVNHSFTPYGGIGQKTDIKINALPIGEPADVAAGFDLILVDNGI